ncbi:hypothetical protein ACIRQP_09060 [Streptomyces sp. NPDC102274]|uniref:hypothetical protein n=1 Tax=Streptomyces sp. NPDC102274 TaxID=3366151 RepID=UPI00381EE58A
MGAVVSIGRCEPHQPRGAIVCPPEVPHDTFRRREPPPAAATDTDDLGFPTLVRQAPRDDDRVRVLRTDAVLLWGAVSRTSSYTSRSYTS